MTDIEVDAGNGRHGERGASLLLALAIMTALGVVIAALLTFTETGIRNTQAFREERDERYSADGALEQAIAWAAQEPRIGIDPDAPESDRDPCNLVVPAQAGDDPGSEPTPELTVTCQALAGSGSGLPAEVGATPEYSILTLGQRQNEPPPYSGPICNDDPGGRPGWDNGILGIAAGIRGSGRREYGIRLAPARQLLSFCQPVRTINTFQVKGKVFSHSPIAGPNGTNIELLDNGTGPNGEPRPPSEIKARGGCRGFTAATRSACQNLPLTNASPMVAGALPDGEGYDPRIDPGATQEERDSWALPDLRDLKKVTGAQILAKRAECDPGARTVIVFEPGWYDDIGALNTLFKDPNCQNATFWFAPARGDDGEILGRNYKQGLYYFDFTVGNGGGCQYYDAAASTTNQWCIGNDRTFRQVVVGGTPQGWSPFAEGIGDPGDPGEPAPPEVVMDQAQVANLVGGTSPIWSNQAGATRIGDNSVASYSNPLVAVDRPITLINFTPKVSTGAFAGGFNIEVAHNTPNNFNRPQITVSYNSSLFGGQTCGTYTLQNGNFLTTPDQLSAADQVALGRCLNHGDKINNVQVRFTASGCTFFCGAQVRLDGMRLKPGDYPNQPTFPRPPSDDDSGGDCDPDSPGVSFIFGGDSHVYVASGSMELCSGPAAQNPVGGQQIALYGVPGLEPIRPFAGRAATSDYNGNSRTIGVNDVSSAYRIGEPAGVDRGDTASISYGRRSGALFDSGTMGGGIELDFPQASIPAGTEIANVTVRASYNSGGIITGPQLDLPNCGRITFPASHGIPQIDGNTQAQRDATCVKDLLATGSFSATYWARTAWVCAFAICLPGDQTDQLDGIELVVTLRSTTPGDPDDPTPVPNGGCLINGPNYWNAAEGGENNCAIVKADQTRYPLGGGDSRGRFSVKGTIYAPSAAIDIDDEDVLYPFFSRGLVARHLMFRGFRYRIPVPLVDIPSIDSRPRDREAIFTACEWNEANTDRPAFDPQCDPTKGDKVLSRARVRYELDESEVYQDGDWPTVAKVLWWNNER